MAGRNVLLHVGYHKTGTTWLQRYLFNNKDFGFVSPMSIKDMMEIIIFPNALDFSVEACRAEIDQRLKDIESKDLTPVFSTERFSGHPHSGGYDSKMLGDRLHALFPEARILICIREQKKMILACYNQYIKKGGAISVSAYLRVFERKRVPLFDFRHFMYHRLIHYYQETFGRDNVLVLPYELFVKNGTDFVSRIIEFGNRGPSRMNVDSLPIRQVTNRSVTGFELVMRRLMNFTVGTRNSVNQFSIFPLNGKRSDFLFEQIQKLDPIIPDSLNRSIMTKFEKTVAEMVGTRYCESNRITSELIGFDLSKFGYQV
jgi:hypothetical protein